MFYRILIFILWDFWLHYFIIIFRKLCFCITNHERIKILSKQVFGVLLGIASPLFQNNFLARLLVRFSDDNWGGWAVTFSMCSFVTPILDWYEIVCRVKKRGVKEFNYKPIGLQTLNCKDIDTYVIIYIVYILHSILWVFAYFMGGFLLFYSRFTYQFWNLGWPTN